MRYERENIRRMSGYVPGEQPDEAELQSGSGAGLPGVVKLNTNENPYPPAEAVMAALRGITAEQLRRYPPPTAGPLRRLAAEMHGLEAENVIAVNGGDELLRLAVTTFVEPGRAVGVGEPSYSLYPVLAAVQDCPVVRVGLSDDWSLPADFAERMNEAGARLVFIVNPHAPSGRLTAAERLAEIAEELEGVLLIDEAYVDFVDPEAGYDPAALVRRFDNVLVLRTLSKGYSLAGLRIGYGLGAPSLIEPMLTRTKDSYNTDIVAQALAVAALEHRDAAQRVCEQVRRERGRLAAELERLGLRCPPSQSNFVLATAPGSVGGGAAGLYESLKRRRIFVRYFDEDRLRDKLRITVGAPEQNDALLRALRELTQPSTPLPR